MFRSPFKREPTALDRTITSVYTRMYQLDLDDEEYPKLLGHLERLEKLKNDKHSKRPSPDTMFMVAGNLLGILVIVAYEQKHVMTSKGLGFILKAK